MLLPAASGSRPKLKPPLAPGAQAASDAMDALVANAADYPDCAAPTRVLSPTSCSAIHWALLPLHGRYGHALRAIVEHRWPIVMLDVTAAARMSPVPGQLSCCMLPGRLLLPWAAAELTAV